MMVLGALKNVHSGRRHVDMRVVATAKCFPVVIMMDVVIAKDP